jgi:hypothetical protein
VPATDSKKKSKKRAPRFDDQSPDGSASKSAAPPQFPGGDEGRPGGVERAPMPRE